MAVLDLRVGSSRIGEDTYVVAVSGELDVHAAGAVEDELAQVIDNGARGVIVDMMGTSFVDSAGLGVLLTAARTTRYGGGTFVIAADDARILRVLQITGLDRTMHVERSLVEAVEHVVGCRHAR